MSAISTSVFELFKIGPGPSSSHTIGPMRAGSDFLKGKLYLKKNTILLAEDLSSGNRSDRRFHLEANSWACACGIMRILPPVAIRIVSRNHCLYAYVREHND